MEEDVPLLQSIATSFSEAPSLSLMDYGAELEFGHTSGALLKFPPPQSPLSSPPNSLVQ